MGDVEAVGNEEKEVFDSPDSLGSGHLGQGPAHPDLDAIAEQQGDTNDACEDLFTVISACHVTETQTGILPSKHRMWRSLFRVSWGCQAGATRRTDVDVSFLRPWNVHCASECKSHANSVQRGRALGV